ncbi:MAG: flagellar export protein FliJ [Pseudomonadota bacterium]
MRDRRQRLAPVQKHAEREEQTAAEALAEVNAAVATARKTLAELEQYRAGYHDMSREQASWHGAHWRDYHTFLSRLDQAIAAQRDVVSTADQRRLVVLRMWQDKRRRSRSLEQLTARLNEEARVRAEAAQQKIDDAMALSRTLRRQP